MRLLGLFRLEALAYAFSRPWRCLAKLLHSVPRHGFGPRDCRSRHHRQVRDDTLRGIARCRDAVQRIRRLPSPAICLDLARAAPRCDRGATPPTGTWRSFADPPSGSQTG